MVGSGGPGHSDQDPDAERCTVILGQEVASEVPWEADQAQAGAELRRCLPSAPCGHPPTGLPALAGKELTSRLLSVNV